MGRSQETFGKKEVKSKKDKKRKEKDAKRLEKRGAEKSSSLDDMIAYVDEFGVISNTPPDPSKKVEINAEDIILGIPQKEIEEEELVKLGTVTFFNPDKGYGFIRDNKSKESVFVHINNVDGDLKENNQVSFEVEMGPKGSNAVKVKLV